MKRTSLPLRNCVVGSGGSRLPLGIIADHGVEGSDHFSHDGDDDDLGFLVGVGEAIGEGPEGGIVSGTSIPRSVQSKENSIRLLRAIGQVCSAVTGDGPDY